MKRLRRLVKATDSGAGPASHAANAATAVDEATKQTEGASDGDAQRSSVTSDATEATQVHH